MTTLNVAIAPSRSLLLVAALCALAGCIDEASSPLPADANAVRLRSVRVDASQCLLQDGKLADCPDAAKPVANGLKAAGMRGINGAPIAAVAVDQTDLYPANYANLHGYWARIPVGYGCDCTLQGLFPDSAKSETDAASYKLDCLTALIGAVRTAGTVPVWTAAYNLGDGKATCAFANNEQQGTAIANPTKWAKVVRYIAKYYDRDLPNKNAASPACKPPPTAPAAPWDCTPSLFNIEFGRDPFGAGGFPDTPAGRQAWLVAYKQFATELRGEFPVPGNDVNLIAPSIVLKGEASVADTKSATRSPMFDFIDYVVANKLALSYLSFEVEASTPVEARKIVFEVSQYAAAKGLTYEKGLHSSDGKAPIPIWITDLRLAKLPIASVATDAARLSAYKGAFFAATKILWQGLVSEAMTGFAMRTPTVDKAKNSAFDVGKSARESDLMWFGQADQATLPNGSPKQAAWHSFWLNDGFLGARQMLKVEPGLDPLDLTGKHSSLPDYGLILMATREACVDALGAAADCVSPAKDANTTSYDAVTAGKRRTVHLYVADLAVEVGASGKEILEHTLRMQVDNLPKDVKVAGYQWARMDGVQKTWMDWMQGGFTFSDQGLVDVTGGSLHLTGAVPVPSLHYIQLFY